MAENWGDLVVKLPDNMHDDFKAISGVRCLESNIEKLALAIGIDDEDKLLFDHGYEQCELKGGYFHINFFCSEWHEFASLLQREASIEFYARIGDEYGTQLFLAKKQGQCFELAYEDDSDAFEYEEYAEKISLKQSQWQALLPEFVISTFPALSISEE